MFITHLPQKIVSLRHPQCLHNVDPQGALERGIGNWVSPLTPAGEAQRDITAVYILEHHAPFDAVFASTFTRTHTIPQAAGFVMRHHPQLDERSMGVWHCLPRSQVLERYPGEEDRLKGLGYYDYKAPEGESCDEVEARLRLFLQDETLFEGVEKMLISGHGITGLCLRKLLLGGTVEDWHSYERMVNASVTVYEKIDGVFVCTLYNHVPWEGLINTEQGTEA